MCSKKRMCRCPRQPGSRKRVSDRGPARQPQRSQATPLPSHASGCAVCARYAAAAARGTLPRRYEGADDVPPAAVLHAPRRRRYVQRGAAYTRHAERQMLIRPARMLAMPVRYAQVSSGSEASSSPLCRAPARLKPPPVWGCRAAERRQRSCALLTPPRRLTVRRLQSLMNDSSNMSLMPPASPP